MNEAEFWSKLKSVGWLDSVSESERARLRGAVTDFFKRDPKYAFYSLAVTNFDPECIEGIGPEDSCSYYSVLSQLAEKSYGKFAPTELHDELDKEANIARISFKHAGESFSCEVPQEDDWFHEAVLELVNRAIRAGHTEEQFIPLPFCDQTVSLVLVSPEIYERAVGAGLIPGENLFEE